MGKKPTLGFPTQKEARAAIQAIVNQYGLEQEFFHPLLQRLFLECCYWHEDLPCFFTKFKWTKHTLPNGATTERWFNCYSPEMGIWFDRSWNKALINKLDDPASDLRAYARFQLAMPIVSAYRDAHPFCEHCAREGRTVLTAHVHHTTPMKDIIARGLALLSADDLALVAELPIGMSVPSVKFIEHIREAHKQPGLLLALCVRHHNDAHGKKTHTSDPDAYDDPDAKMLDDFSRRGNHDDEDPRDEEMP